MRCIDLTHLISREMPVYPGTEPPRLQPANTYERDGFQETLLTMYSHTGTHMDPPAHLFAGRTTLDQFPVEQFIGRALVIHCPELREGRPSPFPRWSRCGPWPTGQNFCCFTLDGADIGGQSAILAIIPVSTRESWTTCSRAGKRVWDWTPLGWTPLLTPI